MQRTGNTRTMIMPTLVLPTSGSVAGQYMFTEIDPFSGITNFPRQPSQTNSIYQQSGPNEGASDQQHSEPARKRRLTLDQTKSLECSFATDSKLEPERKKRLAVELGLQPRQVAIWYQNRRARTKTKHLEEKYDALYTEYQGVLERNRKLEAEIITLKKQLGLQEKFTPGGPKDVKPSMEKPQEAPMSTNVKENANQAALLSMNQKAKVSIECNLKQQTSVDTEVDSNNTTCATASAHNGLAHNVDSPASQCTSYLQETDVEVKHTASGTKEVVSYNIAQLGAHCELDCLVPNYPLSPHNHFHDQQQQQHQLLQQLQHHYNSSLSQFVGDIGLAETQENVGLPTTQLAPVYINDNFFDDYRFKLEDETACLYFDLATTEV